MMPLLSLCELDRKKTDVKILKPFEYINKVPSKYHHKFVMVFNHWLQAPEHKAREIGQILQELHTVTLLIDDIQDDSKLRYGVPAAHIVYSLGLTINAASNAMAVIFKKILELGHPLAINIYSEFLLEIHRGQGIELYWRDNFECPTEKEHLDSLKLHAGSFFIFGVQLLQLFSDNKENYLEIATLIGVYYALRDIYCNLFNRKGLKSLADNTSNQGFNDDDVHVDSDITDGKFSLPIIHSLKYSESATQVLDILKQRTYDRSLIKQCISLLQKCGSDIYTEEKLRTLESDIYKEINRLGGNPMLTSLIKELEDWRPEGQI